MRQEMLTGNRTVGFVIVGGALVHRGDVFGPGGFQDVFGLVSPLVVIAMNGEQNPAVPHTTFIAFRLIFGHTEANQAAGGPTQRSACTRAGESRHDGTCRNEWPEAWNGKSSDPDQPS